MHMDAPRREAAPLQRLFLTILIALTVLNVAGCGNDYRVRFLYPREGASNTFNENPPYSLFVSEPEDLRSSAERRGRGFFQTLHFPSDEKLDRPASQIVRRALMQDLLQTRMASLVQNPANADYVLSSQLLSMTTKLSRPASAWIYPLATGVAAGAIGYLDVDTSHGIKLGLVGAFLGTFLPAPAKTEAMVEVRLELRDRETNELVWSTNCFGSHRRMIRLGLTAREDKRIAEDFLPKALKKANACAVGQLYAHLQENRLQKPMDGR
jgi:hypothetical protein